MSVMLIRNINLFAEHAPHNLQLKLFNLPLPVQVIINLHTNEFCIYRACKILYHYTRYLMHMAQNYLPQIS
jgi:hypothetical protein